MDKKSPLFQLMDLRMNGVMNDITAQDEAYQSLIKKAGIYTGRLDSMNLPKEERASCIGIGTALFRVMIIFLIGQGKNMGYSVE